MSLAEVNLSTPDPLERARLSDAALWEQPRSSPLPALLDSRHVALCDAMEAGVTPEQAADALHLRLADVRRILNYVMAPA